MYWMIRSKYVIFRFHLYKKKSTQYWQNALGIIGKMLGIQVFLMFSLSFFKQIIIFSLFIN
jgi:hypothetical protein